MKITKYIIRSGDSYCQNFTVKYWHPRKDDLESHLFTQDQSEIRLFSTEKTAKRLKTSVKNIIKKHELDEKYLDLEIIKLEYECK